MSLASEILALLRASGAEGQRVLPGIASDLERFPGARGPAMEGGALERQLSRGSQLREPPIATELAGLHQPQLPIETEDPRFAMALEEDQRLSPLEKQALMLQPKGDKYARTGPLVPDNSAFPEQRPGWEPEAIPEDALQHESGQPRVMDAEMARRATVAQDIPPAEFYDQLPAREEPHIPPIGPRIDQLPETIDPELHPGVLQEPEFVMQTPVMAKLRELTKVQRLPIEERLQTRLDNANAYVERAFPNKAPLEDHNLGPNQVAPHRSTTDETGDFAKSMLQKWEQKLRGGLTAGEEGTVSSGVNAEDVRILKEFNRMMRTNPHEAVAFLANAVTGRKGEISDFTGSAKVEGILGSNKRDNRQRMAGQFRSAAIAKQEQGLPAGEHARNQQYSAGKARIPVQTEEIVNPEAVKGIRPGVPEDPFEGVRSGHVRSIVVGDKELRTNTGISGERIKPGGTIAISDGQGKLIYVKVVDVRRITEHDAAEVGLRQGTTPVTMSEIIRQQEARTGPQFEVVFKPLASQKEGVESAAVTSEAIREGKKSAKAAYMGIGVHSDEARLPKEHVDKLRAAGYDMDTPIIDRSKQTGSPFIVAHKTNPKDFRNVWTEDVVAKMRVPGWANTPNREAMLKEGEAALLDPLAAKYTSKSQIRFNKNKPRDASQLGQGPNLGRAELGEAPFKQAAPGEIPEGTKVKGLVTGKNQHGTFSYSLDGGKTWADRIFNTSEEARAAGNTAFMADKGGEQIQAARPTVITKNEATANTLGSRPTDRRDNEFTPTSVGKAVTNPQTIVSQMRSGHAPAGSFFLAEHFAPGFAAKNSDASLALSPEALQRANDPKSLLGAVAAINKKVGGTAKQHKQIILSITGPDAHALKGEGVDAMAITELLQGIANHPGRSFDIAGVLTEGQPGMQEAAVTAARKLGIPTAAVMGPHMQVRHPKTGRGIWVPREIHEARFRGEDVSTHYDRLAAEGAANIARAKGK